MYVDDVLFGADNIDDAISLAQELSNLLIAGGFPLRKWSANQSDLLKHLPVEWLDDNPETSQSLIDEESKLLGILWNSHNDYLSFFTDLEAFNQAITKRKVLSLIARLYDPLGLLSSIVCQFKLIMQSLWVKELGWY